MVFRENTAVWKKLFVSLPMLSDFELNDIDSSQWKGATTSSTISLRSKITCQACSSSGTRGPLIKANKQSRAQFSSAFPLYAFSLSRYVVWHEDDLSYLPICNQNFGLNCFFSKVKYFLEIKTAKQSASSTGIIPSNKSCDIYLGESLQ